MNLNLVLIVILLGHIIGDFYVQSNQIASRKYNKIKYFLLHVLLYSISMGAILLLTIPFSQTLLLIWAGTTLLHLIIDCLKGLWIRYFTQGSMRLFISSHSFVIDQFLHIISILIIWYLWGSTLTVRSFVGQDIIGYENKPVVILLCFLCILRPVGLLIGSGEIWDLKKHHPETSSSVQNAGKMIGYLERTIVLLFLMYQQFGAIAFILTAKSVARFKEIETNKDMAEYYLIGTLLSVASAFMIAFLFGLCG